MRDLRALSILDAALNLTVPRALAVEGIARAAAALVQRGAVVAWCLDGDGEPVPGAVCFERGDPAYIARFLAWQRAAPPAIGQRVAMMSPRALHIAPDRPYADELGVWFDGPFSVCVLANTGDGGGVHLAFSCPEVMPRPGLSIPELDSLACHLASAWRVRRGMECAYADRASAGTSDRNTAGPALRDILRRAVARDVNRDRPRSTGELDLWDGLLDGRWTLLDAFTRVGTRYVVAYRNPAEAVAFRALPPLERRVLTLALAGRAGKWISLDLRLSESTVTRTLRMALRRLGVSTATALAGVQGARFELLDGIAAGVDIAAARLVRPAAAARTLSDAERSIIDSLLGGMCIAAIARQRGTSWRTVANQVSSSYRKLGVSSRRELLALLN